MYELQRRPVKVVKEIKQNAPPILTTFTRRIREGVNSEHLHREIPGYVELYMFKTEAVIFS